MLGINKGNFCVIATSLILGYLSHNIVFYFSPPSVPYNLHENRQSTHMNQWNIVFVWIMCENKWSYVLMQKRRYVCDGNHEEYVSIIVIFIVIITKILTNRNFLGNRTFHTIVTDQLLELSKINLNKNILTREKYNIEYYQKVVLFTYIDKLLTSSLNELVLYYCIIRIW